MVVVEWLARDGSGVWTRVDARAIRLALSRVDMGTLSCEISRPLPGSASRVLGVDHDTVVGVDADTVIGVGVEAWTVAGRRFGAGDWWRVRELLGAVDGGVGRGYVWTRSENPPLATAYVRGASRLYYDGVWVNADGVFPLSGAPRAFWFEPRGARSGGGVHSCVVSYGQGDSVGWRGGLQVWSARPGWVRDDAAAAPPEAWVTRWVGVARETPRVSVDGGRALVKVRAVDRSALASLPVGATDHGAAWWRDDAGQADPLASFAPRRGAVVGRAASVGVSVDVAAWPTDAIEWPAARAEDKWSDWIDRAAGPWGWWVSGRGDLRSGAVPPVGPGAVPARLTVSGWAVSGARRAVRGGRPVWSWTGEPAASLVFRAGAPWYLPMRRQESGPWLTRRAGRVACAGGGLGRVREPGDAWVDPGSGRIATVGDVALAREEGAWRASGSVVLWTPAVSRWGRRVDGSRCGPAGAGSAGGRVARR